MLTSTESTNLSIFFFIPMLLATLFPFFFFFFGQRSSKKTDGNHSQPNIGMYSLSFLKLIYRSTATFSKGKTLMSRYRRQAINQNYTNTKAVSLLCACYCLCNFIILLAVYICQLCFYFCLRKSLLYQQHEKSNVKSFQINVSRQGLLLQHLEYFGF